MSRDKNKEYKDDVYVTSLPPTAYDDTDDPKNDWVSRDYPDRPEGTVIISGPLGPGDEGVRRANERHFPSILAASDWAHANHRVVRRITEAEKFGRWAFLVYKP